MSKKFAGNEIRQTFLDFFVEHGHLQGTSLTSGAYAVHARALNCPGAPAAPSITAVFSVITGNGTTTGPATTCNNVFSTIPVGAAAQQVCTFNVP